MMKSYEELNRISRNFRDVATDLMRSDYNTFNTAINFFRSYCNDEPVIQEILAPVIERPFDSTEWFNQAIESEQSIVGSGDATLPTNKLDALKTIYDLLWDENAQHKLISLGHATMFKRNFNEQIRTINDKLTNLLIRYIIRELEEKIELVKPQSYQGIQNFYINAPSNIANQSSQVNQTLYTSNPEVQEYIQSLRIAIEQSGLPHSEKQDALETVDMIEEETTKNAPSKTRIQKYLGLLPHLDSIVSIGTNLISLL